MKYTKREIFEALHANKETDISFGDAEREKVLSNPYLKEKLEGLCRAGDELRNTPTCELRFSAFKRFETDGNRTEYESDPTDGFFIRRRKLVTFSMLSWLYGKDEDISALEDVLWAICSEYTWSLPAHLGGTGLTRLQKEGTYIIDLFASETAEGIAETLALIGEKLSPIVRVRCEYELKRRIFDRLLTDCFGWQKATNNWICVCAGGCGMAALYAEKDEERLAEIIASSIDSIGKYENAIENDGACTEGLGYWAYGFGFYVYFAELLLRRTAGKINLFDNKKMHLTAHFFCDSIFPKGQYVSFADMWGKKIFYALPGLLTKISEIYPDVKLRGYELMDLSFPDILRMRFPREIREFVWTADDLEAKICDEYETKIYPDTQIYLSTSKNNISIAAKAGHNAEAHNHNDVGSFMLIKDGERILDDIGASEYVQRYFKDSYRYTEFFAPSSTAHNLPIIDGIGQMYGKDRAARDVIITENGLCCDIAGAYDIPYLTSLVRRIEFDRECGGLTLRDKFVFSKTSVNICERFICPTSPKVNNGEIIFGQNSKTMTMRFDPDRFEVKINSVTDFRHDYHAERITYTVDLVMRTPADEAVEVVLVVE